MKNIQAVATAQAKALGWKNLNKYPNLIKGTDLDSRPQKEEEEMEEEKSRQRKELKKKMVKV